MTLIAFRISPRQWQTDEGLHSLLHFVDQQQGVIDELALFTGFTHAPLPLDQIKQGMQRAGVVMQQLRTRVPKVGINVLTTIGHHEENMDNSLNAPWQRVVDPQGRECRGCYCPVSPQHLDYVRQLYELVASSRPDFIWIDDDVRLFGHMPVGAVCFCDRCIERFSNETGQRFTRAELVNALKDGRDQASMDLRKRWLEHNRQVLENLFEVIEQTVHAVVPSLELGFMTGDRAYEGYAFGRWAKALAGTSGSPVRWRPGGGFYDETVPLGMVAKGHDIGRQVSQLPDNVEVIQSEVENFPYQRLRKSVTITTLEAGVHMAAGATGTAFNVLGDGEPFEEYQPFLERIAACRPFYEQLAAHLRRDPVVGVWPAWNQDTYAANGIGGDWFNRADAWGSLQRTYVLGEIGIPLCYGAEGATMTVFSGNTVRAFTDAQLKKIFEQGVLLDGPAIQALEEMGLNRYAGVKVDQIIHRDMREVFGQHPFNEPFAGWSRDCRQSFWAEPAYSFQPISAGVQEIAYMVDYGGNTVGTTMTAFENSLGGRVVVAGYFPWQLIHSLPKSYQLKSVCEWLSADTQPVTIESYARVVVWARGRGERFNFVLLNASWDPVDQLTLRLRSSAQVITVIGMDGSAEPVKAEADTGHPGQVRVTLNRVDPWSLLLLSTAQVGAALH